MLDNTALVSSMSAPVQMILPIYVEPKAAYLYPSSKEDIEICPVCSTVVHDGYCGACDLTL